MTLERQSYVKHCGEKKDVDNQLFLIICQFFFTANHITKKIIMIIILIMSDLQMLLIWTNLKFCVWSWILYIHIDNLWFDEGCKSFTL